MDQNNQKPEGTMSGDKEGRAEFLRAFFPACHVFCPSSVVFLFKLNSKLSVVVNNDHQIWFIGCSSSWHQMHNITFEPGILHFGFTWHKLGFQMFMVITSGCCHWSYILYVTKCHLICLEPNFLFLGPFPLFVDAFQQWSPLHPLSLTSKSILLNYWNKFYSMDHAHHKYPRVMMRLCSDFL